MVLHDVAQRADLLVEAPAPLDAEVLSHGDLDPGDVVAVPRRFQEGVGEPEHQQVQHLLLAEEVVDAEHALLVEAGQDVVVELARRREVTAERLLEHHAPAARDAAVGQAASDVGEQARRDGEVDQRHRRALQPLAERGVQLRAAVVPLQVGQGLGDGLERLVGAVAVGLHALPGVGAQAVVVEVGPAHADDALGEATVAGQGLQGGEQLLAGQVPRGAEEDQRVAAHGHPSPPPAGPSAAWTACPSPGWMACPPKALRMIAMAFIAGESS